VGWVKYHLPCQPYQEQIIVLDILKSLHHLRGCPLQTFHLLVANACKLGMAFAQYLKHLIEILLET